MTRPILRPADLANVPMRYRLAAPAIAALVVVVALLLPSTAKPPADAPASPAADAVPADPATNTSQGA